jgi:arylsulfatase A-like enzyme
VDEGVKTIINRLQSAGKLNNTVVIFTSDNGYFQGHHRIPNQKNSYYEESIRVPLMIRGPGIPANVQRNKLVSNIDLAPTIVALAGATSGLTMDGTSLLPLIKTPAAPWRTALFIDGKMRVPLETYPLFNAVRTSRYLYVEHQAGTKEFYDLQTDPYQLQSKPTNPAYAGVIANLQSKLTTLKNCSGATCWVTSPELVP